MHINIRGQGPKKYHQQILNYDQIIITKKFIIGKIINITLPKFIHNKINHIRLEKSHNNRIFFIKNQMALKGNNYVNI